jgi:hypothetical protein
MKCTGRVPERKPGQEHANVMLLSQAEEFALLLSPPWSGAFLFLTTARNAKTWV